MEWDAIHRERAWGQYPCEELVRFVCRQPQKRGMSALDVGCGAGANLGLLVERGYDVTGIDSSWEAVKRARAAHPRATVLHSSIEHYSKPLKKGYDLVVDCFSLAYLSSGQYTKAMAKIIYSLSKDGALWTKFPFRGAFEGTQLRTHEQFASTILTVGGKISQSTTINLSGSSDFGYIIAVVGRTPT